MMSRACGATYDPQWRLLKSQKTQKINTETRRAMWAGAGVAALRRHGFTTLARLAFAHLQPDTELMSGSH